MLPQDAHQHEYRRDENQCERHLRHGSRGEGFDVNVGAGASVVFFVPAGESGEEEEGEEGEDEGDDAVCKKKLSVHAKRNSRKKKKLTVNKETPHYS